MLDFGNLPKPLTGTVDYFPGNASSTGTNWIVWNKPRSCMFIRILCIGAGGGGGGGGDTGTANSAAGGGGGGASGAMATLTIPAVFIPDRLYVSVGIGGKGGAVNTSGGNGLVTQVCIAPSNTNIYNLCYANGGGGGGAGSNTGAAVGGTGGTAAAQADITTANQGFQGHFNSIAGQNGAVGGTGAGNPGGDITYPTTGLLLSGGSGGGGISIALGTFGGYITAPASQNSTYTLFQTFRQSAGVELFQPLMSCGGGGGSSGSLLLSGGDKGDNGGFGSGGGGGGASINVFSAGAGGNGGAGLVVIHTW
jgi:hypothetical protein